MIQNYKKMHRYFVDIVLLSVVLYAILRKITDISGAEFIKNIFQPDAGENIISFLTVIIIYALIARLVIFTLNFFEKIEVPNLCFPHYRCLLNNNKEIESHIKDLKNGSFIWNKIDDSHSYDENMQNIHRNFSEHLVSSLKDKHFSQSDIFLSLFHDKDFNSDFKNITKFHYSSHYDPTLYETSTSELDTQKQKQKNFGGIRVIKKKMPVMCHEVSGGHYDVGNKERRKSIKHYMGIPLKIDGSVIGVLNIEFHNKSIFSTPEQMKAFHQKEIQAFTYLYEYQLHKKYFFKQLNEQVVA